MRLAIERKGFGKLLLLQNSNGNGNRVERREGGPEERASTNNYTGNKTRIDTGRSIERSKIEEIEKWQKHQFRSFMTMEK